MASLKELKGRINSVKSTQKITKAKQMVAAAKLRRAQANAEAARPYAERISGVMTSLARKVSISDMSPKLLGGNGKSQIHLLVVASSDKGLCGAFNSNIVKAAKLKANELIAAGRDVKFYTVGRKGRTPLMREFPDRMLGHFDTTSVREPGYDEAAAIASEIIAMFDDGKFDIAHLFYSRFHSALVQEPSEQQIIPAAVTSVEGVVGASVTGPDAAVEYEPDEGEILEELLPRNLRTQIFGALLENAASEQGASMTAMDNATRNAGDLINRLTIEYNRSRQAAITTELVEIISGAEAL